MLSSILDLILIVEKRRYYISEENKQKYKYISHKDFNFYKYLFCLLSYIYLFILISFLFFINILIKNSIKNRNICTYIKCNFDMNYIKLIKAQT